MKKLILLLCIPFIGIAQTDYELAFNSTTLDYVEMPNASALIVNSTTFSMTGWVYPQANTTAHSGIMGFRNNIDADFYLLKLQNSNNVEARFRNSSGTSFDILANNLLDFNQWQHLAFTYDGSNIHLYKNGVLISSTPANGTITQTSQSFKIGSLDWNGTGFFMNGSLDEIRLWDITLSQNTISNWMCTEITNLHPNYNNLAGYWRLNEGVGTSTTDLSINGNSGTLMGAVQWQVTTSCFASTVIPLTYVPDDNFETYLEANGMGDGIALNDNVLTLSIEMVMFLDVSYQNISDLTGIEDFTVLQDLNCNNNQLLGLDVSQNTFLTILEVENTTISSLDLSLNINIETLKCRDNNILTLNTNNNLQLEYLDCDNNQITNLSTINNQNLEELYCSNNQISSLDLSSNITLHELNASFNQLTFLDIRNGNNQNMSDFYSTWNSNLNCIDVDNPVWSTSNWTVSNGNIDAQHYFSNNCNATAIEETTSSEKELLKIVDVLGRVVLGNTYQPLFYIYNDGTVEKQIIIE